MYKLLMEKRALEKLQELKTNKKVYVQLVSKIFELLDNPYPNDAKKIKGKKQTFLRVDSGEWRIVYTVEGETVKIILLGKRNDDEIYNLFERL